MKDHSPNCETRIFPGAGKACTCGAVEDGYDGTKTTNAVQDAPSTATRWAPSLNKQVDAAFEIIKKELREFVEASLAAGHSIEKAASKFINDFHDKG